MKKFKRMKNVISRMASLALAFVLLIGAFPFVSTPASAATYSWPTGLSQSAYLEYVLPGRTTVFTDSTLKTPGSNGQAYNAYADQGDTTRIYGFDEKTGTIVFDYPAGKTWKRAHCKISTFFGVSAPKLFINSSQASVKTYTITSDKVYETGSIARGDRAWVCAKTKDGTYYLVIYDAVKNDRLMKAAFIRASDLDKIKGSTSAPQNTSEEAMSFALYKDSGGRLSCGFDGYSASKNVSRHEGLDFVKAYGSAVYSLTDGVITRVTQGYNGSKGLSTIAIYSQATNKTVVYLHTDPLDSLYVGQSITRGMKIGTESWRGISNASGSHTHIELREGEKTAAAVSIGDKKLDNSNPTSFWNSQGYQVK